MKSSSRYLAGIAYLFSLPGALIAILIGRDDAFVQYHARQSLRIAITAIATPLIWAVVAWLMAWIPSIGGLLGVMLFSMVIAVEIGMLYSTIIGITNALQGKLRAVPLVGKAPPRTPVETIHEIIEELDAPDPLLQPTLEEQVHSR